MAAEEDVGIECFANSCDGFKGILKQRFSDFVVNEVDPDGQVVHLTSTEIPAPFSSNPSKLDTADPNSNPALLPPKFGTPAWSKEVENGKSADLAAIKKEFQVFATAEDAEMFGTFLEAIATSNIDEVKPVLFHGSQDKEYRTKIHGFFKKHLPFTITDTIDAQTSVVDGDSATQVQSQAISKSVRVRMKHGSKKRGREEEGSREESGSHGNRRVFDSRGGKGHDPWEGRPKYLQFHLYKENLETQHAINLLSRSLGAQGKNFGFAGTKDKRGITVQRLTVYRQTAEKVAGLNSRLYNMKVGNFKYVESSLNLGQLSGNQFIITLRSVEAENEQQIEKAAMGLRDSGFINYFGLQRFGVGSIGTHKIGACLLRGEWQAAIDLLLMPQPDERDEVAAARSLWHDKRDPVAAWGAMPRQMVAECAVLDGMSRHGSNLVLVLACIPRTLRMMYVHAYQSYLWNKAASFRIQHYGSSSVVEGDIVKVLSSSSAESDASYTVKHVSAEDIAANRYSIQDIVLPLPGNAVIYPRNRTAEVYETLASEDGIDLHKSSHNVKEYSIEKLTGDYRSVILKPQSYSWQVLQYTDPSMALVETDIERLPEFAAMATATAAVQETDTDTAAAASEQTALQIRFILPASSYATMAVRELLKSSSAVAFHKALNGAER